MSNFNKLKVKLIKFKLSNGNYHYYWVDPDDGALPINNMLTEKAMKDLYEYLLKEKKRKKKNEKEE